MGSLQRIRTPLRRAMQLPASGLGLSVLYRQNFGRMSLVLLCAATLLCGGSSPPLASAQHTEEEYELAVEEQNEIACELYYNESLQTQFFSSINPFEEDHYIKVLALEHQATMRCRSIWTCPNAPVSWCVYLYHPREHIKLCYNSSGNLTYITERASLLRLQERFVIQPTACTSRYPGCITLTAAKYLLGESLLSCTAHGDGCSKTTYTELQVAGSYNVIRPQVTFVSSPYVFLNQMNVLLCEVSVNSEGTNVGFFGGWTIDGVSFYSTINRHPFCGTDHALDATECPMHTLESPSLEAKRVRMYQLRYEVSSCPFPTDVIRNWLVIENATVMDAMKNYTCYGRYRVTNPGAHDISENLAFPITPVFPLVNITTPPLMSNTSYHLNDGESLQWTCSVQAGVGDTLLWMHNGVEVHRVDVMNFTNNTKNLSCSLVKSDKIVVSETRELGVFERQFTSTLFLCHVTELTSGLYECVVNRSRGESWNEMLWSATVTSGDPVIPAPSVSLKVIIIVLSVLSLAFVVFVLACVATLCTCIRRRREKKEVDKALWELTMGSMSVTDEILAEFRRKNSLKKDSVGPLNSMINDFDPLEFPRSRLILLDRILGEGTFGVVKQARAEGIVESTPERNIVAVKTTKPKAPPYEINNFWEELQLMKSMVPHGNIVNLLGYCTTPGGPIYMIIEYANKGSLKDYLKACKKAIMELNHIPQVQATFRSYQTNSSSGAAAGPHMVYKIPLSAQNSVFSSAGTPTTLLTAVPNNSSCSKFDFSSQSAGRLLARDRLVTQDSGIFVENPENSSSQTIFNRTSCSAVNMAHSMSPLTHDYVNSKGFLYMEDVQNFALQIACGLKHLEDIQIVHCDLAARNILIAEGFVLKIGDFGMARDVSEKEYYRKQGGRIPVKWTAPEALTDHIFSFKSDIWSYAVLLWEIFTYGEEPYPNFKIRHSWDPFVKYIMKGNRLLRPTGCPDSFYDLMKSCWHTSPDQRPNAEELIQVLSRSNLLYEEEDEDIGDALAMGVSDSRSIDSHGAGHNFCHETQV